MTAKRRHSPLHTGALLILLLGTVLIPGLLSLSTGIVALALSRQAFDVLLGILVLVFASTAVIGGILALAFLRRSDRLVQLQTEFVANVSHELRTPLAGIRLLVETMALGRAETPERRTEVMGLLQAHIRRLEELVENILRWQSLESGRIVYERTPLRVDALVEEAVKSLAEVAHSAGHQVEVSVPADLPEVLGDRKALVGAMRNLIDNALKFGGDRGPIEVVGRHIANEVVVEVRDQGPGIPRHERKRIFERFYRVPVHRRSSQGIGLGLAIVRHVIDAHRGHIQVESEPGMGSVFIVRLPVNET